MLLFVACTHFCFSFPIPIAKKEQAVSFAGHSMQSLQSIPCSTGRNIETYFAG